MHWCGGLALVFTALLLVSCGRFSGPVALPPLIEGATFVGNASCYDCHTNYVRVFPSSAHGRLHLAGAGMPGQTGCESCHGPGSLHIAAGGGRGRHILNPGRDASACYRCHVEVHAEFTLPQHHPVPEGHMNCVQCHDPHGRDILKPAGGPAMARLNENCATCHREQAKPVVYIHEAMREGCVACHQPHGSINPKMLVERDNNLCLKCHAQVVNPGFNNFLAIGNVPHSARVMQGSCWSAGCHSAVHGSNIDPFLRY